MESKSRHLVTLITGVAIGAVVGVLLAPEKGEVLQSRLKSIAKDLLGNLLHKSEDEDED